LGTLAAVALPNHHTTALPTDAGALNVKIQEWRSADEGRAPSRSAVGADGALWFTEQMVNKLGRLDPKTANLGSIRWRRTRIPGRRMGWLRIQPPQLVSHLLREPQRAVAPTADREGARPSSAPSIPESLHSARPHLWKSSSVMIRQRNSGQRSQTHQANQRKGLLVMTFPY